MVYVSNTMSKTAGASTSKGVVITGCDELQESLHSVAACLHRQLSNCCIRSQRGQSGCQAMCYLAQRHVPVPVHTMYLLGDCRRAGYSRQRQRVIKEAVARVFNEPCAAMCCCLLLEKSVYFGRSTTQQAVTTHVISHGLSLQLILGFQLSQGSCYP